MRDVRRLAHVKRWAIVPKIKEQSVAEHSYFVALYTLKICKLLEKSPKFCLSAVQYAMEHDAGEAFTGDIPSPLKKRAPDIEKVENNARDWMGMNSPIMADEVSEIGDVKNIVNLADKLDALLWLMCESSLGSTALSHIQSEIEQKTRDAAEDLGIESFVNPLIEEARSSIGWYIG